ncbi:MAG: 2-oxo-4-hydroxy-4-carboxy-5-ureidoimidazoline decarboxylase [Tepidisphaeraceae bacterium]
MSIDLNRLRSDFSAIAACTATPGNGATRPTFSDAWGQSRDYVIAQATLAGCDVRTDAFGNIRARPKALGWDTPAWLVGSHIDTVPHGGDYDGVAGVVVALELLRSAHDDGITLPVELIVFAEEEGPTFGLGMIGSRLLVGELDADAIASLRNSDGKNYIEAGAKYGVDPSRFAASRLSAATVLGLIELHIEQGPGMWRRDQRLAVVIAIAGRRQYKVSFAGAANHAGATSMQDRKDALACACEAVVALEQLAPTLSRDTVVTVGRLSVHPNAVNVIADRVDFTIDFRSPDDVLLTRGDTLIRSILTGIASRRQLTLTLDQTEAIPARPMAGKLVDAFRALGVEHTAVSGALHDSAVLAPHVPTVMLFVPSKGGISHNPAEFSRVEDVCEGAKAIAKLVRRTPLATLNAMSKDAFVKTVGGVFEHSPWIAERAHRSGPFKSIDDLHAKMASIVRASSTDEQLGLIRAHPDLVGKLAREGRLTRESTSEQAAAGLTSLSAEEIVAFEKHNAAYREKFGFPFIICARQNRKDAILAAFPVRLKNDRAAEIATALSEIEKIALLRLRDAAWE